MLSIKTAAVLLAVIVIAVFWIVSLVMAKKEYEMAKKGYSKVTSVYNKKDRWIR